MLFPILLMAFVLSMERLEARVRRTGVGEDEVVEFLDQASASDVQNLARDGLPRALDVFRLRHLMLAILLTDDTYLTTKRRLICQDGRRTRRPL